MTLFKAHMLRTSLDIGTVLRITPQTHRLGDRAPVMKDRDELDLGRAGFALVLFASRDLTHLATNTGVFGLTPLTPAEIDMSLSFEAGTGMQEWVVREKA